MTTILEIVTILISNGRTFTCRQGNRIEISENYGQLHRWQVCFFVEGKLKFHNTLGEEVNRLNF